MGTAKISENIKATTPEDWYSGLKIRLKRRKKKRKRILPNHKSNGATTSLHPTALHRRPPRPDPGQRQPTTTQVGPALIGAIVRRPHRAGGSQTPQIKQPQPHSAQPAAAQNTAP